MSHLHLLLNHIPIIGLFFVSAFLIFGLIKKNDSIINFSLISLVVIGVISGPVLKSGDEAEEALKAMNLNHEIVEEHEEAGELAFWCTQITAVLAIVSLVLYKKRSEKVRLFRTLTVSLAIISFILMVKTGLSGGKIRRPELQQEQVS